MTRAPVLFVSHGAPTVALEPGDFGRDLAAWAAARTPPRAIAVVSAHWTAASLIGVTSAPHPRLIHDFGGFPEELYRIEWPAQGAPDLAARIVAHLEVEGFQARLDPERGLDHGAWVPLRIAWPDASVPVVQLALPQRPPPDLLRFGAALAPFRDEGVLLLASGGVVHSLARVRWDEPSGPSEDWAATFDAWIAERIARRDVAGLARWREEAPHAALAAPTSEHLDPLLVAIGATSDDDVPRTIHAGFTLGTLGMRTVAFEPAHETAKPPRPPGWSRA